MKRFNFPNIIFAFYLYIYIHDNGKCQVEAREHYEGLGSILTSEEDGDIHLPINQVPNYDSTEAERFDDENTKPRNFLIERRESKKLTPEELKSIRGSKRRKKCMKKDKKMADLEASEHCKGLGSILTSKEDKHLPINQVPYYEPVETETFDDENTKPRNFLIKRRESKKLTSEELKSIRGSKIRKKRMEKDKKMADLDARGDYEGLGSVLTSTEDIHLPINQVPYYEPVETETFDNENTKSRNFLIKRRDSNKLAPEELNSKREFEKIRKKHIKKYKKMTDVKTFMKDLRNQTKQNKVKPLDIVIDIEVND